MLKLQAAGRVSAMEARSVAVATAHSIMAYATPIHTTQPFPTPANVLSHGLALAAPPT